MNRPSNHKRPKDNSSEERGDFEGNVVGLQDTGKRLDNLLIGKLKHLPRSLVYKLIRKGRIKINGKRANASVRVENGDFVRIPTNLEKKSQRKDIPKHIIRILEKSIIFEDESIIVVNKPAGLGSHAGSGLSYGLIEIMRQIFPTALKLDLAHRLDRDTSGCILLSKNLSTLRGLHQLWYENRVEKTYVGLFRGLIPPKLNHINASLRVDRVAEEEKRAHVGSGKAASTTFSKKSSCGSHTLATLRLNTGKMHQIRAHARHINHPLAGDTKYGDRIFNRSMTKIGLSRLFLHASHLKICSDHINLDVEASIPELLSNVISKLSN